MNSRIVISTIQTSDKNAIYPNQIKSWVKSGKIFRHFFRYNEAILLTNDLRYIVRPFAAVLLVKLLSRNKSAIQDRNGNTKKITLRFILSLFSKLISGFLKKNRFLKSISREVSLLQAGSFSKKKRGEKGRPIYLRTDLAFGIKSGGSVGHIAGVLNHLENPVFITSDIIPTVRSNLEIWKIDPDSQFADFRELSTFQYNDIFFRRALQIIGVQTPSFIYQRYSANNFSGVKLSRHFQVPFVLEYNGSEVWVNRWWGDGLKYEKLSNQIEMLNLQQCDLVVVVSQALKDELIARGISKEKVLVNPNGVNIEAYSPEVDGSAVRNRYGLGKKVVVGFIGTFGKWHGAEVFAEAICLLLREFPNYKESTRFLFIGDGVTMPLVKDIIKSADLLEYCIFTHLIPQIEGPTHLAACDVLVSPHVPNLDGSPFFGSPTKLFEYMAMGKGIVASDLDQIGQILKHEQTAWLVKPADPKSLMHGMKILIDDPSKRTFLGQAARKEAVLNHTWKSHTQKILQRLQDLIF